MNIAIFASAFYPHIGGVEELCRQLAHEYRRRGWTAVVFTERWPRTLPEHEEYEGIPVWRLPFRVPSGSLRAALSYLATTGAIRRRLAALLRRYKIELLHVQCVSSNAFYALTMQRTLRLPLVITLQGELTMDAQGLFERNACARDILRRSLQRADAITACSRQTLADAEVFFGQSLGERGRVVYNGIALPADEPSIPFDHPRPYLFAIGRHVPQKGFDVLLRALAELRARGTACDLLLAGDGPEHAALRHLADQLNVSAQVLFMGRVDHALAMRIFAGCRLFVLPSRLEPFGIVNLEAMSSGKPVVASRVGGVPEILTDGETALLVPPENPTALADAVATLWNDAALCQKLGDAGRVQAGRFTWPQIADEYLAVYAQAQALTPTPSKENASTRSVASDRATWLK